MNVLMDLDRHEMAREAGAEAVGAFRVLAAEDASYSGLLAQALAQLSEPLAATGHHQEAWARRRRRF